MSGFGEVARKFGPTLAATAAANGALIGFVGHGEVPEVSGTSSYEYHTDHITGLSDWYPVGTHTRSTRISEFDSTTDFTVEETPAGGTGAPGEDARWDETVGTIREIVGKASGTVVVHIEVDTPADEAEDRAISNALEEDAKGRAGNYPETQITGGESRDDLPKGVRVTVWAYDETRQELCSQDVTIERDITTGEEPWSFPYLIPLVPMFPLPPGKPKPPKQSAPVRRREEEAPSDLQPRTSEAGPEPGREWSPKAKEILGLAGAPARRVPQRPARSQSRPARSNRPNRRLPGWLGEAAYWTLAGGVIVGGALVYKEMPIEGEGPCKTAGEWAIHWCSNPAEDQSQDPSAGSNPGGSNQPTPGAGGGNGFGNGGEPVPEVCPPESRTRQVITVITRTNGVEDGTDTQVVYK